MVSYNETVSHACNATSTAPEHSHRNTRHWRQTPDMRQGWPDASYVLDGRRWIIVVASLIFSWHSCRFSTTDRVLGRLYKYGSKWPQFIHLFDIAPIAITNRIGYRYRLLDRLHRFGSSNLLFFIQPIHFSYNFKLLYHVRRTYFLYFISWV